jgi:hypothetical protein
MHKQALEHRKYDLEAQQRDINKSIQTIEEEWLYQAEVHRIDEDRQRSS